MQQDEVIKNIEQIEKATSTLKKITYNIQSIMKQF